MNTNPESTVAALHAAFCEATGFEIKLNHVRLRFWFEWLKWGDWTPADLHLVVGYLRKEIATGNRNPGSLKFSNLIEQPDRFEEDLAMARAKSRPSRPAWKQTTQALPGGGERVIEAPSEDGALELDQAIADLKKSLRQEVPQ